MIFGPNILNAYSFIVDFFFFKMKISRILYNKYIVNAGIK